ncbi:MAG: LysR family transcriptional regulator [Desulfovibrionaceae bacterium]|nr:LysR family transcriptional regulator [Desulfovibrionaceae bacterium]
MTKAPRIYLKLWLQHENKILLGLGRVQLLEKIGKVGSLKKAAESLGMSYRAAWGRIKRTEAAMGFALLEAADTKREGCRLSPAGRETVEAFLAWYEDVYAYALRRAEGLPFSVIREIPPPT